MVHRRKILRLDRQVERASKRSVVDVSNFASRASRQVNFHQSPTDNQVGNVCNGLECRVPYIQTDSRPELVVYCPATILQLRAPRERHLYTFVLVYHFLNRRACLDLFTRFPKLALGADQKELLHPQGLRRFGIDCHLSLPDTSFPGLQVRCHD
jgi:hypothetical protein